MVGRGGSLPSGTVGRSAVMVGRSAGMVGRSAGMIGRSASRVAASAACSTSMKESVRSLAS
jgi:hypothetical protein